MGLVAAAYRIEIDGIDVTDTWRRGRRLLEISVEDREGEASDACTLVLDDRTPHVAWPPEGASLRLWLGATEPSLVDLGTYTLDAPHASSPPDRLRVTGHAASYVASGAAMPMQTERTRAWSAVTLGDIAGTIARDHGLVSRVESAVGSELVGSVEQIGESDLVFLARVAKRFGARVRVKGAAGSKAGALEVVGAGPSLPMVEITPAIVEQWSLPLGVRLRPGTVTATWHHPMTGASGAAKAGSGDPLLVLTEVFDSASAAQSACKSRLNDGARDAKQLAVSLVRLSTSIASGTKIHMRGFRSEVDGTWNVVEVTHRADGQSPRTTFTAERIVT